jgi:hypothetical protein
LRKPRFTVLFCLAMNTALFTAILRQTKGLLPSMKNSFVDDIFRFLFSKSSRMVLIPFVVVLLVFAFLFVIAEGTAWAPFIYAIF